MRHDDIVLAALVYRRNIGADLDSIRTYACVREATKHTSKDDKVSLARLVKRGIAVPVGNSWFLTPDAYRLAKGTALLPRLKDEDAWILLSLLYLYPQKPSKLEDVIATADSINHAIPGLEETYGALNRLDAAGLIKRSALIHRFRWCSTKISFPQTVFPPMSRLSYLELTR